MLQTPVHQSYLNYQQLLSSTPPPLDSPINDLLILIAIANVIQTQRIQIKDKRNEEAVWVASVSDYCSYRIILVERRWLQEMIFDLCSR